MRGQFAAPGAAVTNSRRRNLRGLDNGRSGSKIPEIPATRVPPLDYVWKPSVIMTAKPPAPAQSQDKKLPCKHPRVQIVGRDEDSEFVECKECGEVFESSEFKDMNIEEAAPESEI